MWHISARYPTASGGKANASVRPRTSAVLPAKVATADQPLSWALRARPVAQGALIAAYQAKSCVDRREISAIRGFQGVRQSRALSATI